MTRFASGALCAGIAWYATQSTDAIEADLRYRIGSANIELLGVCKATESEHACWGPQQTVRGVVITGDRNDKTGQVYSNIDPAKIKSMYAVGDVTQKLTISGIPLDPLP